MHITRTFATAIVISGALACEVNVVRSPQGGSNPQAEPAVATSAQASSPAPIAGSISGSGVPAAPAATSNAGNGMAGSTTAVQPSVQPNPGAGSFSGGAATGTQVAAPKPVEPFAPTTVMPTAPKGPTGPRVSDGATTGVGGASTPLPPRAPQIAEADANDRCETNADCGLQPNEVCCAPSGCNYKPGTHAGYAAMRERTDRDFCPRARVVCLAPNTCSFPAGKTPVVACVNHVCKVTTPQAPTR